jgi:hypothetical protein
MVQNGAKAVGGIRYLPVGSKPTARMGVLGEDGEPDIKPLGQKKAALQKDAERKAKQKIPIESALSRFQEKYQSGLASFGDNSYIDFVEGKKYIKVTYTPASINTGERVSGQTSTTAFIDKSTGDIYKADSATRPAKGIRGNIYDPSTFENAGSPRFLYR